MSKHDPMKIRKDIFGMTHAYDQGGDRISNEFHVFSLNEWEAKMRRLVASWNACQGIETETLESIHEPKSQFDIIFMREEAIQDRYDEAEILLRDCEEYFDQRADAEYFPDSPGPHPNEEMKMLADIRAFLKAREGG